MHYLLILIYIHKNNKRTRRNKIYFSIFFRQKSIIESLEFLIDIILLRSLKKFISVDSSLLNRFLCSKAIIVRQNCNINLNFNNIEENIEENIIYGNYSGL